jgi:hypothetical protein
MAKDSAWDRRRLLATGLWSAAGAVAATGLPSTVLAGGLTAAPVAGKADGATVVTVLRWLDGVRLPQVRDLRPGWMPPCASLKRKVCPVRVNDLMDHARVQYWSAPAAFDIRLIGFDGQSPVAGHTLDVWFPVTGATSPVPFRLADVRANRLQGASASVHGWSWDGRVWLQVGSGAPSGKNPVESQIVELPAEAGVYLVLVHRADQVIDPAALAFAEEVGGPFHRRIRDLRGKVASPFGYFAVSLARA